MEHWKLVQWTFLREVPLDKILMPHGTLSESLRYLKYDIYKQKFKPPLKRNRLKNNQFLSHQFIALLLVVFTVYV